MDRLPRLTAHEAETRLLANGFQLVRVKGSHHVYQNGRRRVVLPVHPGKILHPKIIRQVFQAIDDVE